MQPRHNSRPRSPINRLFTRRPRYDAHGFLDVELTPEVYRVEHLFETPAALVVGPPWLGKTTLARALYRWLQGRPANYDFANCLTLLEFASHGAEREVPPVWWQGWRSARPSPACWIVDALDEGEERLGGMRERLAQLISELEEKHRSALRLLILTRQRDWLGDFRGELKKAYGLGVFDDLPEFELGPLDQDTARELLGSPDAFERVTALIQQFDLQPVAGYPAALDFLRTQREDASLSVVAVWRGILQHLVAGGRIYASRPDPLSGTALRCRGS